MPIPLTVGSPAFFFFHSCVTIACSEQDLTEQAKEPRAISSAVFLCSFGLENLCAVLSLTWDPTGMTSVLIHWRDRRLKHTHLGLPS